MSEPLKPGDVVCLPSGGPLMTVRDADAHTVGCCWFAPDAEGVWSDLQEMNFPAGVLVRFSPDRLKAAVAVAAGMMASLPAPGGKEPCSPPKDIPFTTDGNPFAAGGRGW